MLVPKSLLQVTKRCEKPWTTTNDAASPQPLSTKVLKVYLLSKQIAFPVLISQLADVLPSVCGNTAEVWGFVVLLHPKVGPVVRGSPTPRHGSIEPNLIVQPIYHLGKLSPCSQIWFKCNNRDKVNRGKVKLCLPARQYHTVTGQCCKIFWAVKKFQGSKKDMPFLLLGQTFKHSYIPSLGYIPVCKKYKDSPKVFFSMS